MLILPSLENTILCHIMVYTGNANTTTKKHSCHGELPELLVPLTIVKSPLMTVMLLFTYSDLVQPMKKTVTTLKTFRYH